MYFFDLGLTPFEAGKQVGSSDLVKKNRLFFYAFHRYCGVDIRFCGCYCHFFAAEYDEVITKM